VGYVRLDGVPHGPVAGETTTIFVWYPVTPVSSPPAGTPYDSLSVTDFFGGFEVFEIPPTDLQAVRNAPPAPGLFKMVIDSSSARRLEPPENYFGLVNLRTLEILASHGFVAVGFSKRGGFDINPIIDAVLDSSKNPVAGSIDPNKMGIVGHSNGGREVAGKIAGFHHPAINGGDPVGPDPRFVAGIFLEGSSGHTSTAQLAETKVPIMSIEGGLGYHFFGRPTPRPIAEAVSVSPRYLLSVDAVNHLGLASGYCDLTSAMRNRALELDPTIEPFADSNIFEFFGLSKGAGLTTRFFWYLDIWQNPFVGGVREFCETAGVNSPVTTDNFSMDLVGNDGIQDAGTPDGINDFYTNISQNPFAGDPNAPAAYIPIDGIDEGVDDVIEILSRYEVAFFKVHLEKDGRYRPFLTPGFANNDDRITMEVTGGENN
jgi:hypothetical protein